MFLSNEIRNAIHSYKDTIRIAEHLFSGFYSSPTYPDIISIFNAVNSWANEEGRPHVPVTVPEDEMKKIKTLQQKFFDYFIENQQSYLKYGEGMKNKPATVDLAIFVDLAMVISSLEGASKEWKDYTKNLIH